MSCLDGKRLYRNKHVNIERFTDGDAVVMDISNKYTHILNSTSLCILDLCTGKTAAQICDDVLNKYQIEISASPELAQEIVVDVNELLKQFYEKGIINDEE
jgi:hypothetical protein